MKKACLFLLPALLAWGLSRGQKAYPIALVGLYGKTPVITDSKGCYSTCTTETDPNNGSISIKDNGPAFAQLQDQLLKVAGAPQGITGSNPQSPPSAEQIQQMQQQAMQRAMAAQSAAQSGSAQQRATPTGASSAGDIAVMKQIGQAQQAAGNINRLASEMSQKVAQLDRSGLARVKIGPNCPEVQQGGYAGPTCACMKEHATTYAKARVAAENAYLMQANGIIADYLGRMKAEAAVVDNMEEAAKYGDAVANPTYRQMVVSIQRQALGGLTMMLGFVSSTWNDAAKEYANELNAESGASSGCHGR